MGGQLRKKPLKQLLDHQRTFQHGSESQTNEGRGLQLHKAQCIKTSHTISGCQKEQNANWYFEEELFDVRL